VQGLVDRSLRVKREAGVDLGRYLARDDFEDFGAELDEQPVERGVNLLVDAAAVLLGVRDRFVNQGRVLGLFGRREDEGGVRSGILGLVLSNGWAGRQMRRRRRRGRESGG